MLAVQRAFALGVAHALTLVADYLDDDGAFAKILNQAELLWADGYAAADSGEDPEAALARVRSRVELVLDGLSLDVTAQIAKRSARAQGIAAGFREVSRVLGLEPDFADDVLGTATVELEAFTLRSELAPKRAARTEEEGVRGDR